METRRIRITFIADLLGTASGDKELHESYIASKAPDALTRAEEVEALGVDEVVGKGRTVFPRVDGVPVFWNYQIKGFFKEAAYAVNNMGTITKLTAYKKKIDKGLFIFPDAKDRAARSIEIHTDQPIGDLQRPLRAQTLQGERVAIADSEMIASGAWAEFDIVTVDPNLDKYIDEWLDYGSLSGMGQWRNAGYGAFVWEKVSEE